MGEITHFQVDAGNRCPLTRRERQVLELVANGLDQNQIAAVLFRSRRTIDRHTQNLRRKLAATTLAQAVSIAWAKGWLKVREPLCWLLIVTMLAGSDTAGIAVRPARCVGVSARPTTSRLRET